MMMTITITDHENVIEEHVMNETPLDQVFYLKSMAGLLAGFVPPKGPFDPAGAWKQTWRICTLTANGGNCGSVTIARTPGANGPTLAIEQQYSEDGESSFNMRAQVECRADALATPLRFEMACRSLTAEKKPVEGTELRQSGGLREGKWTAGRRVIPVGAAYALNWGLFDAVQRLPRPMPEPLRFDLIKDFDELKPAQTLAWRESLNVRLGGNTIPLDAWQLTGEGTLPTIYYRDAQGRLLFVVAGLEGYILGL